MKQPIQSLYRSMFAYFISLSVLFIVPTSTSTALSNSQYMIFDLQYNTSGLFADQASQWTITGAMSTQIYSTCNGVYLLGGYNVLLGSSSLTRQWTSLPSHQSISITFKGWFLDDWELSNYLYVSVSNATYRYTNLDIGYLEYANYKNYASKVCGNDKKDLINVAVSVRVPHIGSSLVLSLVQNQTDSSLQYRGQLGFRDIKILMSNKTYSSSKICAYTDPLQLFESGTGCSCYFGTYYYQGYCYSCDSSCETCFDQYPSSCLSCPIGSTYNGTNCIKCDSSCLTCSGTASNQCLTCYEGAYLYPDNTCQSGCLNSYTPRLYNGYLYCDAPCSSTGYVYSNGSCLTICPSPFSGVLGGTCNFPCSSSMNYYQNQSCLQICQANYLNINEGGYLYCNYPCQATEYLHWNGSCLSSCPSPGIRAAVSGNQLCNFPCSSQQYLHWNNTCSDSCSFPLVGDNSTNYHLCSYPCSSNEYLYWNGSCLSTCLSPLATSTISGSLFCNFPCSSDQYLYWNSTCSDSCSSPLVGGNSTGYYLCNYPCTSNQYLYWNGSCLSTCSLPLATTNTMSGSLFCNFPCANAQYLYWNGTCASSCNSPLVSNTSTDRYFCSYPCTSNQYLYLNGSCMTTCSKPFSSLTVAGESYCNLICKASEYLYQDGSCLSSCTVPMISTTNQDALVCNFPCTASNLYYYTSNQTCQSSCPKPFIVISEKFYNSCSINNVSENVDQNDPVTQVLASAMNTIGNTSSACVTAITIASSKNPTSISSGMLAKMLQYTKFLNINYSNHLEQFFRSSKANTGFLNFLHPMPNHMRRNFLYETIPPEFSKYKVHSSFTVNFWQGILSFATAISIYIAFRTFEYVFKKCSKAERVYLYILKARFAVQNFLFTQFYNCFCDITLFSLIEMRTNTFSSGMECLSLILALCSLILGVVVFIYHFKLIRRYQIIKVNSDQTSEAENSIKAFEKKHEGMQSLYTTFKDNLLSNQVFLFIFTIRTVVFNIIIAMLFEYPTAQVILIFLMSLSMLGYLAVKRPLKHKIDLTQYLVGEIILLIVNGSLLIIKGSARKGKDLVQIIEAQGKLVIALSMVLSIVPIVFIVLKIALLGVEYYKQKKNKVQPEKKNDSRLFELSINQIENNNSQIVRLDQTAKDASFTFNSSLIMIQKNRSSGIEVEEFIMDNIFSSTSQYKRRKVPEISEEENDHKNLQRTATFEVGDQFEVQETKFKRRIPAEDFSRLDCNLNQNFNLSYKGRAFKNQDLVKKAD